MLLIFHYLFKCGFFCSQFHCPLYCALHARVLYRLVMPGACLSSFIHAPRLGRSLLIYTPAMPGACLSSAAALTPGDQAHCGPITRTLGILARVVSLLPVVGQATVRADDAGSPPSRCSLTTATAAGGSGVRSRRRHSSGGPATRTPSPDTDPTRWSAAAPPSACPPPRRPTPSTR